MKLTHVEQGSPLRLKSGAEFGMPIVARASDSERGFGVLSAEAAIISSMFEAPEFGPDGIADPRLRAAAALPAGNLQLQAVFALDLDGVCFEDRLVALELVEASQAAIDAEKQRVYAALARGRGDDWSLGHHAHEVALVLKMSAATAASRMAVGRDLLDRFGDTLAQLAAGDVCYSHTRALVEETQVLTPDKAALVEKRILTKAPRLSVGEYRHAVQRAVLAVAPEAAMARAEDAQAQRAVWLVQKPDCTATLGISGLPIAEATAAYQRIDSLARAAAGNGCTLDQRRADTALDLLQAGITNGAVPAPAAASVEVVVSADTLQGGDEPGELTDYGPIPAPLARALANGAGSRWRRLVIDPATGQLKACGTKTYGPGAWQQMLTDPLEPAPEATEEYRPTTRQRRYVKARDRRCCHPGCYRRAWRADLDHTIPWPRGDTDVTNLHPRCREHHQVKTKDNRWRYTDHHDGTCTTTTPAGRRYTRTPFNYHDWL